MMASLYQSESMGCRLLAPGDGQRSWFDTKNVTRLNGWIQAHVVSLAAPRISRVSQQVVYDVRLLVIDAEVVNRHMHHRVLHVMRVGVHGDENIRVGGETYAVARCPLPIARL